MEAVPIFAHRGASSFHLENTFPAFKKALEIGADGIELDVQLTKDGVLVVFHDVDLQRLAGSKKFVAHCEYDELIRYKIGKRFKRLFSRERIMSFQEVLSWANKENIALNVELKESLLNNEQVLKNLLPTLQLPLNSHFSSFHPSLLETIKAVRPDLETAFIVTKKFDWSTLSKHAFYDAIHAHKRYYKSHYLTACGAANIGMRFYGIQGNERFLKNPHPAVGGH